MSASFTDEPTLEDQLNRAKWVQSFADNIRNCDTPYVFGIHGDWGAGKTSFLHQLHFHFTGRSVSPKGKKPLPSDPNQKVRKTWPSLVVVWFEAWRFQNDPAPVVALLQQIRKQLSFNKKALAEARKLAEVTIQSLLGTVDKIGEKIFHEVVPLPKSEDIQKHGEKYEAEHFYAVSPSTAIREHLENVIEQLIGDDGRIIVLVDDLDRCNPEAAFRLLEGIKIYLNLPRCVFVLAMDHRNLEQAIAQCLPGASRGGLDNTGRPTPGVVQQAREYLEKICQDVWQLPLIPLGNHEEFLRKQYFDDQNKTRLGEEQLADTYEAVLAVIKEGTCLPTNARKLKSFANTLRRFVRHCPTLAKGEKEHPADWNARMLLIMSCLYQFHPELYRRLETAPQFYNEILGWAKDGRMTNSVFRDIEMPGVFSAGPPGGPPGSGGIASSFPMVPDPATGNVFRLRDLVTRHAEVGANEITQYLLRHARI